MSRTVGAYMCVIVESHSFAVLWPQVFKYDIFFQVHSLQKSIHPEIQSFYHIVKSYIVFWSINQISVGMATVQRLYLPLQILLFMLMLLMELLADF